MFFGKPILAFDVVYNRETTNNRAYYYTGTESLAELASRTDLDGKATTEQAHTEYVWRRIARQYEEIY